MPPVNCSKSERSATKAGAAPVPSPPACFRPDRIGFSSGHHYGILVAIVHRQSQSIQSHPTAKPPTLASSLREILLVDLHNCRHSAVIVPLLFIALRRHGHPCLHDFRFGGQALTPSRFLFLALVLVRAIGHHVPQLPTAMARPRAAPGRADRRWFLTALHRLDHRVEAAEVAFEMVLGLTKPVNRPVHPSSFSSTFDSNPPPACCCCPGCCSSGERGAGRCVFPSSL